MHHLSYKEELEGNTEHSTAAYIKVREDASTGLTYKLPLEGGYARSLLIPIIIIIHSPNYFLGNPTCVILTCNLAELFFTFF
ncbi:palindromic element RPE1 domain-containing protein [Rickettsia sibirica]|uniref:Uncharacterized protein n=1 Tax=Rickettsia conorii (strain ATCC VR-613 / Malish 7) TaxID=272944 RepID=Q92G73_RICCN|nr:MULTISPECIES: palindromic element RPE1 domain-containing protein [spotted fever group]AAL03788.1 unknown [Rickettsia conorii str. Malish 7]AFC75399.1 hypothetical protein MC1_06905 [Rickettsia parkeri str. Portsmouth]QCS24817.1 palindromic element RPE1 domain-containing protein [Rickettsia parkeri]